MRADWSRWAAERQLTQAQCESAERGLEDGWSPYYLSLDADLGGGLTLGQLRQMELDRRRPARALPSQRSERFNWQQFAARCDGDLSAPAADVQWVESLGGLLVRVGRLAVAQGGKSNNRLASSVSARLILQADAARQPLSWQVGALEKEVARHLPRVSPQQVRELVTSSLPAAKRAAWIQLVAVARRQVRNWARRSIEALLREPARPGAWLAVVTMGRRATAAVVDDQGVLRRGAELATDDPARLTAELTELLANSDVRRAAVTRARHPGEAGGTARVLTTLSQLSESAAAPACQMTDRIGADAPPGVLSAGARRSTSPDAPPEARAALFVARRMQDPLATLSELPAAELAPAELRGLLTESDLRQLETAIDDAVHQQGLNIARAGPHALSRLCAVSPLHVRRALATGPDGWDSLESFRAALGLNDRQWRQTAPFIRLGDPPPSQVEDSALPLAVGQLTAGTQLHAVVTRATDFGLFVEIGAGVEALVHVRDLSSGFLADPLLAWVPGEQLEVEVLQVDLDQGRIAVRPIQPAREDSTPPAASGEGGGTRRSKRRDKPARRQTARKPADKSARKPARKPADKPAPKRTPPPPAAPPAAPLSQEMADGKAPMRSFSDLAQFYDRKPSDPDPESSKESD